MFQGGKPRICDFVHGSDGVGDLFLPEPTINKVEEIAAEFLVNKVSEFHGVVSVLALGPLTNVALVCLQATVIGLNLFIVQSMLCYMLQLSVSVLAQAVKRDPSFASKVKKIVVLGGAFFVAGNVNPAAEANVC